MEVAGSDAQSTVHLEALLSHVHGNLTVCILEQGRRMEQVMMNQQVRLEACMRKLGVEETVSQLRAEAVPPMYPYMDLSKPHLSETSCPLPPHPLPEEQLGTGEFPTVLPDRRGSDTEVGDRGSHQLQQLGLVTPAAPSQVGARGSHQLQQLELVTPAGPSSRHIVFGKNGDKPWGMTAIVQHEYFNHVMGVIIALNVASICVDADFSARKPGQDLPGEMLIIETFFFFIFLIELLMRIYIFRWRFFVGAEWRWNWFDTLVVFTAAIEEVMKLINVIVNSGDRAESLTVFKLMRIMRLTRVMRFVRVVKTFRELRIMVMSIISTMRTLFWAIVCTGMIMAGFAVYLVTAVSDHQAIEGPSSWAKKYFGSMPTGMLSLFQASTGGLDWHEISSGLWLVAPSACCIFVGYISMMSFAILNILTGICVNNANRAAETDFDVSFHAERSKHKQVVASLKNIFHDSDMRGEGTITWSDLDEHLQDQNVRALFKRIDLEPWHLKSFFDVLGAEEDTSIGIDQFIRGCMRLRCNVKNIDLLASRHEEAAQSAKRLNEIKESVKQLHYAVMRSQAALLDRHRESASRAHWVGFPFSSTV